MFRNCRVLRGAGRGVERADVVVESGTVRFSRDGSYEGFEVVECRDDWLVAPCSFVAWLLPLRVGETLQHREVPAVLEDAVEGRYYDPSIVESVLREADLAGVCGAVLSIPQTLSASEARRFAECCEGLEVKLSILSKPEERSVEAAVKLAEELRDRVAAVEVVNASMAEADALNYARKAAGRMRARLYLHASYGKREVYEARKRWGLFPVERLYKLNILSKDTVVVGGGWVSSWELSYLSEKGAPVVRSPLHDMLHSLGGHFPLREALDSGVRVWLGLGFALASTSPLQALMGELLLQRYVYWDARVTARDVLALASAASELFNAPPALQEAERGWLVVYQLPPYSLRLLPESPELALLRGARPVYKVVGGRLVFYGG